MVALNLFHFSGTLWPMFFEIIVIAKNEMQILSVVERMQAYYYTFAAIIFKIYLPG